MNEKCLENLPLVEDAAERRLPPWIRPLLLLFLLCAFIFWLVRCQGDEQTATNVRQVNKPSAREAGRISIESSPQYMEKLEQYSQRKARQAKESGVSFVAPISGEVERKDLAPFPKAPEKKKEEIKEERKTELRPERVRSRNEYLPDRRQTRAGRVRDHGEVQILSQALGQALSPGTISPQTLLLLNPARKASTLRAEPEKKPADLSSKLAIGDILQAVSTLELNSDAPGPAMAEIVAGPLKGAKVLGAFSRLEDRLCLNFTKLITVDGKITPIRACAVDPNTDSTAMASAVDRHYFERFAGLIAASFLEGFGDAVRRSGTSSYSSVYSQGTQIPHYDPVEQTWIAAGNVGARVSRILEKNTERPPTVRLSSGTDIGVLILEVGVGNK